MSKGRALPQGRKQISTAREEGLQDKQYLMGVRIGERKLREITRRTCCFVMILVSNSLRGIKVRLALR